MNIFKQLIGSIYSPNDISTFRKQGIGKTILYVFFLTLLSILPSIYYFSTSVADGFNLFENTVENDFPPFAIKNGELVSESKTPVTINAEHFTITFDSTKTMNQSNRLQQNDSISFLKDGIIYTVPGQSQTMPYSMFGDVTITKDDLHSIITTINSMLPVIILIIDIIIYLFTLASSFIGVTVLGLIGILLANALNKKLTYGQLWRMAAYSVTLSTLFFTIMESLKTIVPGGFFIQWFVSITILMLSIKEVSSEN